MPVRHDQVATALGVTLVAIGVLGLIPGIELGLTVPHDLVHLLPGIALLGAALAVSSRRQLKTVSLTVGGVYLALGLLSLAVPGAVDGLLGITAAQNLVHVPLGLGLMALGVELGPVAPADVDR